MKTWSFYDPDTGELTDRTWSGPPFDLKANMPRGLKEIEGRHDRRNRRVENGVVVAYQPPQPSPDHEWRPDTETWERKSDVIEREQRDSDARAALVELDQRSVRRLRELSSDPQLMAIEAEAVEVRKDLATDIASYSPSNPVVVESAK